MGSKFASHSPMLHVESSVPQQLVQHGHWTVVAQSVTKYSRSEKSMSILSQTIWALPEISLCSKSNSCNMVSWSNSVGNVPYNLLLFSNKCFRLVNKPIVEGTVPVNSLSSTIWREEQPKQEKKRYSEVHVILFSVSISHQVHGWTANNFCSITYENPKIQV